MNYTSSEEPGKPQSYFIQVPIGQPQQQPVESVQLSPQQMHELHTAKVRELHARARLAENELMMRSMDQILRALSTASIDDGDKGGDMRPPLTPAFYEINSGKLQQVYLRLAERLVNHTEFFLKNELKVKLTDEIKLQKDGVQ